MPRLTSPQVLCSFASVLILAACQHPQAVRPDHATVAPVATAYPVSSQHATQGPAPIQPVAPSYREPVKIVVTGYGNMGDTTRDATHGQRALMAIRAARVDAYRSLAEQLYGVRVSSGTSVGAFHTHHDSARSHVDAYLRGARVVNAVSVGEGNYEVTVELEVTEAFMQCLRDASRCAPGEALPPAPPPAPARSVAGPCGSQPCPALPADSFYTPN